MIAATFGPGQVAYSLLWFFLFAGAPTPSL